MYFIDNAPVSGVSLPERSWECGVLAEPQLISRGQGGEKGEAQQGFVSYDFNVCLSDIPASQSPAFPFIFMHTVSATYLQNAQYHISFSLSSFKFTCAHAHAHTPLLLQLGQYGIEK